MELNIDFIFRRLVMLFMAALLCFAMPLYAFARPTITIYDRPVPLAGTSVLTPSTGSDTYGNSTATIGASNISQGYVMCKYSGGAGKIKVQITKGSGTTYTYNLNTSGNYEVFPLTGGDGQYSVNIYENVSGNQYALAYGTTLDVALSNSFLPFLYPSQYVNFNANSNTVRKGAELAGSTAGGLKTVENVYNYVISNISYDTAKASSVQSGYLPVVDNILASGKGICFDYAAVMAAMLRSQGIPTQLRVGYVSGGVYHAWISTYITEAGWVNGIIQFDGKNWKLMDPTFASSAKQSADIMKFIGNGSNYSTVYIY